MAKYKKKKPILTPAAASRAVSELSPSHLTSGRESVMALNKVSSLHSVAKSLLHEEQDKLAKKPKKIPAGSIQLVFAGDLILVKNTLKASSGLFKRYTELFEALANMDKDVRYVIYRFLLGLMLTSHARKASTPEEKKRLFDLKNELYISMANERTLRKMFEFKYLVSKNFRVLEYCPKCIESNQAAQLERHKWKYCKDCKVDHDFYNLLAMELRFPRGLARMFLSNDQIPNLKGFRIQRKTRAGFIEEEASFDRYRYNSKNLDAIDLQSTLKLYDKLKSYPLAVSQTMRR